MLDDFFMYGDAAGISTGEEQLLKALQAGSGLDAAAFTGGRALQIEDLEATLAMVLQANKEDCKIMNTVKIRKISSNLHQFDVRKDVGSYENLFAPELSVPEEQDQDIKRLFFEAKYIQDRRSVSHQMLTVATLTDALASEKLAGTINVLRAAEFACFHGDAALIPQQYNGLIAQILSASNPNVKDLRGKKLTDAGFTPIDELIALIFERGGEANKMFFPVALAMQMQDLVRDRILFSVADKKMSTVVDQFPTPLGTVYFGDSAGADKFFRVKSAVVPTGNPLKRPGVPAVTLGTRAATAGSQFLAADAGTYTYRVHALNAYGISEGADAAAAVAVAAGQGVPITITPDTANPGTGFIICRSTKDGTEVMEMIRIPKDPVNTTTVYTDINAELPGTAAMIFITENKIQPIVEFGQLLPLQVYNLFPASRAETPFIVQLYGTLMVKAPEWCGMIKNIGYSGGLY
jgi:hypothetical protein